MSEETVVMKRWVCLLAAPLAVLPVPADFALAQAAPPAQTPGPQTLAPQAAPAIPTAAPQTAAPAVPTAAPTAPAPPAYSQADLEQILAPIALYPDELLTQVLVASTYPLEVVTANRWVEQPANKALKGDSLLKALNGQDWDPSVKSLIPFPSVLKTMSEQLDWTQKLGDAFLDQQADVLAAVQTLRGRAQAAGKLQSNAQQTVTKDGPAIVIQPAQPTIVYVPTYNPTVVYGTWPYPASPPVYYPPPPGYAMGNALLTGLAFGTGVAITSALWGWGSPNWGRGDVNVNVNRFNSINTNRVNNFNGNRQTINSNVWQHNPQHRGGVAYNNQQVSQRYRPNQTTNTAQRDAFRGRANSGQPLQSMTPNRGGNSNLQGQRPGGGNGNLQAPRPGGANRGNAPDRLQNVQRPGGGPQGRPQNVQRPNAGNAAAARPQAAAQRANRGSPAFNGIGNGSATHAQAAQGRASRGGMAPHAGGRPGGGGPIHRGGR